jgi:transposase
MGRVSTIGLDIAKRVFQVHCVDGAGAVVFRRQLRRSEVPRFFTKQPPCLAGSRRVVRGIIGAGRSRPWATRCG